MLVKHTYIKKSSIHGIGLFAAETIQKDEVIWVAGFENTYTQEEYESMPQLTKMVLDHHAYINRNDGLWHLSLDNDRFINHSSNPNMAVTSDGSCVAVRRIVVGEEITEDYETF